MVLTLTGAFWLTILPLFHGSRCATLTLDFMMVSHQVEGAYRASGFPSVTPPPFCPSPARTSVARVAMRLEALEHEVDENPGLRRHVRLGGKDQEDVGGRQRPIDQHGAQAT